MTIQTWRCLSLALKNQKKTAHGFTLIELLISMIIASLVITGLLYLVNELIGVDRREAKLENVQRDMQRAMAYVTDDLQEAVYVYSTPTTVTNPLNLPVGAVPVLAFWKPEPLSATDYANLPVACTTPPLAAALVPNCQSLKLRQSYYSLIVYFTLANTPTNTNWPGQSRIVRYSLPQYTKANLATLTQTPGFSAPNNNFLNWQPAPGGTAGNALVLVDYVDSSTSGQGPLAPTCDEFGAAYSRSPSTASTLVSNSFMACISTPGTVGNGSNQDVVVLLRGNAKTAAQELIASTPTGSAAPSQSVLPILQTRVLVRGAANKNPGN